MPSRAVRTKAPGNDQSFGGIKVETDTGWFAARPSGTEDVYKIYAESFRDAGSSEADPERSPTRHRQGVLTMRRLAATLALMFSISGAACAEPVFSFDSTPGKLPKTVVPDPLCDRTQARPARASRFPASRPSISTCASPPRGSRSTRSTRRSPPSPSTDDAQRADVALDAAAETATFTFAQPIAAGPHRLRIDFTARINKFGRGFFFIDYPTDNGTKRMLSSQLEPAGRAADFSVLG